MTDDTKQAAAHTPEPWGLDGFVIFNPASSLRKDAQDFLGGQLAIVGGLGTKDQAEQLANARRIIAAINACQGISTEALERGLVAELRHALGELLTAAGDLDAAIDGATEEFDDERARLNAACRHAHSTLDAGTTIDLHELLASRKQIALVWSIEDVQQVRPDLSEEQAWLVIERVERRHDATLGVTWDTLEWAAQDLFGPAPETDSQS